MLLNASHEITNCGLPQHVQERYVRYKQGNRAIVAWMTKYGPDKYKGKKTLPIKQLVALGNLLCDKVQEIGTLPSDVDFYFKEVIKERSYLSKHFREHRDQCETDEVDTINHEHFTDSLMKIHRILLTAGKPTTRPKVTARVRNFAGSVSSTSSMNSVQNNFQRLLLDDEVLLDSSDEEAALSDAETSATSECSHSPLEAGECPCEGDECATDLLDADGELDLAVEGIRLVQYIASVSESVRACWKKAGNRELSIMAAAATTNVLLRQMIVHLQQNAQDNDRINSAKAIQLCLETVSGCGEGHFYTVQHGVRDLLEKLISAESSLTISTMPPEGDESDKNMEDFELSLSSKILANVKSLSTRQDIPPLMLDGLAFIEVLDPCKEQTSMLTSTACLYILTVNHSAYSDVLSLPSYIALPRISALKLANEGLATLNKFIDNKAVFPCQCVDTLGYRVVQMKGELERFAKYRCWDCLMQNPLVAGNHTLEILDICGYYGLHLIHYRQWSAAVLHSYQALTVLGYLSKIPILEEVCDLLAPLLYTTSTRPVCGFMASWLRYIGARLKFKKGKKYQDHKDSWCMAVPAHVAARSAGLNIRSKNETLSIPAKFDYGTIDTTMRCKHSGWTLGDGHVTVLTEQLEMLNEAEVMIQDANSPSRTLTRLSRAKSTKHKRSKSCQVAESSTSPASSSCLKPEHIFDASFTIDETQNRNIPACKLNLLALFYSTTQIVSGISDTTHADQSNGSGRGQMCLCFVQTILRAADRVQDLRRRGGLDAKGAVLSKNEKECVECFKAQLTKHLDKAGVLHGKGGNWLWTSI